MVKAVFIGDIMLGRKVGAKAASTAYDVVSRDVLNSIASSDLTVANLESPITQLYDDDSLKFGGSSELLEQFKWIDCFSLSNNHINDFGTQGMMDTVINLNNAGIPYNGLYEDQYQAFRYEKSNDRISVVTCTDMMNVEFEDNCPFHTLRVNNPQLIISAIHKEKELGYFTIVFAHVGMLFSKFPNPHIRDFIHELIDEGADCIVTAHSHCLGCHEIYKGVHIFHSLGDFLMDGSSFRRRRACMLELMVKEGRIESWKIIPTYTNSDLQVIFPEDSVSNNMLAAFDKASTKLSSVKGSYTPFFKKQYRLDMLEHSFSTLHFELKNRGFRGFIRILCIRIFDVLVMVKRIFTDRSSMSYDIDGVDLSHKITNKDIQ